MLIGNSSFFVILQYRYNRSISISAG